MGGMTALAFAARFPETVRSLALCDTACRMVDPGMFGGFAAAAQDFGLAALVAPTLDACFSAAFRDSNPDDVARAGDMMATTSLDGFVGCCNAIEAMDQAPRLAGIAVPTLIMVGADDPMTTVADARRLHDGIAGSRLVVLDGAAHFSNIERPDAFNAALRGFLDEN
jgi:3-oxoadipate enol-lactonase